MPKTPVKPPAKASVDAISEELHYVVPNFELASILGITDNSTFSDILQGELQRVNFVAAVLKTNARLQPPYQVRVQDCKFAAEYLPKLVDRFINLKLPLQNVPDALQNEILIDNAYSRMLGALQNTPYMVKYLKSNSPVAANNKTLVTVLVRRILAVGPAWTRWFDNPPEWPGDYRDKAGFYVQMLCSLLLAYSNKNPDEILSPALRKALKFRMHIWWAKSIPDSTLKLYVCVMAPMLFSPTEGAQFDSLRKSMGRWDICGLPGCEKPYLKRCSRCQAIRYCSDAHQKKHWKHSSEPHKDVCLETIY